MKTDQALAWAVDYLAKHGPVPTGPGELVRSMPWSIVARIPTMQGLVYLKQMAPLFAHESELLHQLAEWNDAWQLPHILGANKALGCFLMEDAGGQLRSVLRQHYNTEIVMRLMSVCADIQQASISHIEHLLDLGLPDWRLESWPQLYMALIEHAAEQNIDHEVLQALRERKDAVADMCGKLAAYNIPPTLEHSDFNDSNVLIIDGVATLNDWGDAAVTHPFFSLAAWLGSARRNHGISIHDARYAAVRDSYLRCWLDYGSMDDLVEALSITEKLNPLRFAISFSRVSQCEGFESYAEYHGYLAKSLGEFLANIVPLP